MNEKKIYETPELEITIFAAEDVMTTSGGGTGIKPTGGIELPDDDWV